MRFTVYLERLLPENVRHLAPVEQVFSDGPQQIRRWTLLSAGAAATARLRCLALASLGRWQMSRLAGRVLPLLAADTASPRAGGIRIDPARAAGAHASHPVAASSGLAAPARRKLGSAAASGAALPGAGRPARQSWSLAGPRRGDCCWGMDAPSGWAADGFGLHPDQRWRRCAGLFEAESRVTDPVAFLKRLHHKGQVSGRARPGGAGPVEGRLERLARLGRGAEPGAGRNRGPVEVHSAGAPGSGDGGARHRAPCIRRRRPPRGDRSAATAWRGAVREDGGLVPSRADRRPSSDCWMAGFPTSNSSWPWTRAPDAVSRDICCGSACPSPNRSRVRRRPRPDGCPAERCCWWTWTAAFPTWP